MRATQLSQNFQKILSSISSESHQLAHHHSSHKLISTNLKLASHISHHTTPKNRTETEQKTEPVSNFDSLAEIMSLTIPTNLSTLLKPKVAVSSSRSLSTPRQLATTITCSSSSSSDDQSTTKQLQAFSAALALSSILLSAAPLPASADIAGLTPCKDSKAFAKREKQSIKKLESSLKLYAPDSAPALAIKATIEKTKRRFDNYGKYGLLCGADGLPHLIVSGDQRHWGEFVTPGVLFLYIAGWIGWVGRSYLIAIRDDKKPTQKEIIIDVPLASKLIFRGFIWPVAAYRELLNGELVAKDV